MIGIITSLLGEFWKEIAGVFGLVAGAFLARRSGVKSERNKARIKDHERASEIRNRVRNAPDDSVRKYDDAGYRD